MERLDDRQCRRILEVGEDASLEEINRAYLLLKRVHGRDGGIFAAPAMEEFSRDSRRAVLDQIEAAYVQLTALVTAVHPAPPVHPAPAAHAAPAAPAGPAGRPVQPPAPGAEPLPGNGSTLRKAREAAGMSLDHVAAETHVRKEYLRALEDERFSDLHLAAVNVRGYLTLYLTTVGVASEEVVPAFMKRFLEWQAGHKG